jgi:predicted RecB family nuclease
MKVDLGGLESNEVSGLVLREEPDRDWVSKTEFVRYLRCPYVFWLVDSGQIEAADAWTSIQARLIGEGQQFHADVLRALPAAEGIRSLEDVIAQNSCVLGLREVYRNERRKIIGTPDGIDAAGGALFPIEIKSHREVSASDRLELAFYYILLEPYRTRSVDVPKGHIWLRREHGDERREIVLEPSHIDRVLKTLEAVRTARRDGVQPRLHSCAVCGGLLRDRVLKSVHERKDVSLIFGVGPVYWAGLDAIGIRTYEDLVVVDPEDLVWAFNERGQFTTAGARVIEKWKAHAMSYIHRQPVVCGRDQIPPFENFIALDFEYDYVSGSVWLVGACIVTLSHQEYLFVWADTPKKERLRMIETLMDAAASDTPIITWAGTGAEFTKTHSSIPSLNLRSLLAAFRPHHLDMYQFMVRNVRLPIPGMGLKEVARYFGIERKSAIVDGIEANRIYAAFLQARGTDREKLRRELQQYNQDDLDCTARVVPKLREIFAQYRPDWHSPVG